MKKTIILTAIIAASVLGIIFFKPIHSFFTPGKLISKEVDVDFGTEKRYALPVYAHTVADVKITVTKWHGKKPTKVWEKSFKNIQLKEQAGMEKDVQSITIPNFSDKKDKIIVQYLVTYRDNGSVVQLAYYSDVSKDGTESSVDVTI